MKVEHEGPGQLANLVEHVLGPVPLRHGDLPLHVGDVGLPRRAEDPEDKSRKDRGDGADSGDVVPTQSDRSDFGPVPRAVPILEAMAAFVLADALLEKLGGGDG